jgi:hypothetical protein
MASNKIANSPTLFINWNPFPISIKMFLQFSVSLLALAAIVQATAIPSLNMLERRLADIPLEKRDAGGVSHTFC